MAIPFRPTDEDEDYYYRLEDLIRSIREVINILFTRRQNRPVHERTGRRVRATSRQHLRTRNRQLVQQQPSTQPPSPARLLLPLPDIVQSTVSPTHARALLMPARQAAKSALNDNTTTTTTVTRPLNSELRLRPTTTGREGSTATPAPQRATRSPQLERGGRRKWESCWLKSSPVVDLPPARMPPVLEEEWRQVGRELRKIADEFEQNYGKKKKVNPSKKEISLSGTCLLILLLPLPFNFSVWTAFVLFLRWKLKISLKSIIP